MSHVTTVKDLVLTSIPDVSAAATACGCTLVEAKDFAYYAGQRARCDYKLTVPGSKYEVGLVQRPDGSGYDVQWDNWGQDGRRIVEALGPDFSKLRVEYGCSATARMLARKGYAVRRVVVAGETKIVATKR